jgi:hypothetical protein
MREAIPEWPIADLVPALVHMDTARHMDMAAVHTAEMTMRKAERAAARWAWQFWLLTHSQTEYAALR